MKRQKRVLSPSDNIGADTKIAPYCVAILAKVLTLSSTCDLRLGWNNFSYQQCPFVSVQHALAA